MTGATQRRRGPGRPPLPFERIVETALALVDEEGASGLTLRALAQRLGSSTATLYRHVEGRGELVAHVVDRIFAEASQDTAPGDQHMWEPTCHRLATALFDAMTAHRNAAPLLAEIIPVGPHAMAYRELCLAALLGGGFAPPTALRLTATLGRYVIGMAMQLPGDETASAAARPEVDAVRYPATHQSGGVGAVSLLEEFQTGLDLLFRGMTELLAHEGATGLPAARSQQDH